MIPNSKVALMLDSGFRFLLPQEALMLQGFNPTLTPKVASLDGNNVSLETMSSLAGNAWGAPIPVAISLSILVNLTGPMRALIRDSFKAAIAFKKAKNPLASKSKKSKLESSNAGAEFDPMDFIVQ